MRSIQRSVCVIVCLFMVAPAALGQSSSPASVNSDEAIEMGPFLFSPTLELTWENRDNIFFTPDNGVDDTIWLARAKLLFELPVLDSYLRFSYTPQYRDYQDYELRENWAHFFRMEGVFERPSGLQVRPTYRFVSGNLETREIDPGGELVFGDRQFDKHEAGLRVDYWATPTDGLSLEGRYTTLEYDDPNLFYDYSRAAFSLGWLHQMSPKLGLDLRYERDSFDADDTLAWRDSDSDAILLALLGEVSPVLNSKLTLGYRSTEFDTVEGGPGIDDFSGFVARGELIWELAHGSEVVFEVHRWDHPSAYSQNAYYTATGGRLTYRLSRERLFGHAGLHMQTNDYDLVDPAFGSARSDDITTYDLGIGYRFTETLSLRGAYTYQERESFHPYSYESNAFLIGLVLGY